MNLAPRVLTDVTFEIDRSFKGRTLRQVAPMSTTTPHDFRFAYISMGISLRCMLENSERQTRKDDDEDWHAWRIKTVGTRVAIFIAVNDSRNDRSAEGKK